MTAPAAGVAAAVINYNTAELTGRCVRSLLESGIAQVLLLDNASPVEDVRRLEAEHAPLAGRVRLIRSDRNLGFAGGSNLLIDEALRDPACERVLLLNSDAVARPSGLTACLEAMRAGGHDLMGGRMMKPGAQGGVDSLGIAIYRPLLASNRMSTGDRYLGPTGGCAVYTRGFLEEVRRLHGYVFDPSYFCYAEDSDLCVRARLLGHSAGYCDETVAFHEGQASNAGRYDDFILYHGIRNSIWMVAKTMPAAVILLHLPFVLVLHAAIVLRHTLQGRFRTVVRLYRDAIAGLPAVLRQRRIVQATRRVTIAQLRACFEPRFYERRFLSEALRDLFRPSGGGRPSSRP